MKTNLFLLPALASVLAISSGCQSNAPQTNTNASGTTKADVSASAPVMTASLTQAATTPVGTTVSPQAIRIQAGADATKDSSGNAWLGDTGFEGGDIVERPELEIANTKDPNIYRSEHYAMDSFKYKLPNGKYEVKLHFCETFEGITGPGERVFSFEVEGKSFKDFDVWKKAGGFARAYVETVPVEIADGKLDIKFISNVENPQINGIEILPVQ